MSNGLVVWHSKFLCDPFGDGGAKRSAQIKEDLERQGYTLVFDPFFLPKGLGLFTLFRLACRAVVFISRNIGWNKYNDVSSMVQAVKYFALRIPVILDKYKGRDVVFVWESTVPENYGYVYLMKAAGARIIAYPHNLESLVPSQSDVQTGKVAPFWLYEEASRLRMCDEVFCISKEETWLLSLLGVNSHYYPYYPPHDAEILLEKIREVRQSRHPSIRKRYLALGSATNPPTRTGLESLLSFMSTIDALPYEIHVAGYRTEELSVPVNPSIVHHGTLSKDDLLNLMMNVDGLIINQPATSGALTRICEFRIAGIPVYANLLSARDYYNLSGIYVYDSLNDLDKMLRNTE